jgi:hypothetical protein
MTRAAIGGAQADRERGLVQAVPRRDQQAQFVVPERFATGCWQ